MFNLKNLFSMQGRSWRQAVALLAGVLILCAVNYTIVQREQLLQEGRVVLLELAPVDPRSLMQGDYMALRFQIANVTLNQAQNNVNNAASEDGYLLATLDEHGVAQFKRRLQQREQVGSDEVLLRYRVRNHVAKFATNAYFFQEGKAQLYQKARYGEFRVASNGDMLLTGLRTPEFQRIQ